MVSAFATIAFTVILINQTAQLVQLAAGVHPTLGRATLWGLLLLYVVLIAVPIALVLRLPKPIQPPPSEDSPGFPAHLDALRARLRAHRDLGDVRLDTREEVEQALARLNGRTDELIRGTASQVFLTTAISQNGSIDSLLVLAAQSKLIWRIAHIYYQRPTLRDMTHLYANVAATAFIAGELEDLDLAEQLQPVLASAVGSAVGAIPGFQMASSMLVNSVVTGGANAFLTLRVGIIAKNYCAALVLPERRSLRRSAIAAATAMLGAIAMEGARTLSAAFWKASTRKVGGTITGIGSQVWNAGSSLAGKVRLPTRIPGEE